jgi:hypothetical protein
MKGKLLTEGQLRELPDFTRVHLVYESFDPQESDGHNGPAYVEHVADGTQTNLNIGGPMSSFSIPYEYQGENPDQLCDSGPGDDGDVVKVYKWRKPKKKPVTGVKHTNPLWRQANPRDQLVAILMAVEGTLSNVVDGIYGKNTNGTEQTKLAMQRLQEAQSIVAGLPTGVWLDDQGKKKKVE